MLTPVRSGRFKKDVKLAQRRGKDLDKLRAVLLLLKALRFRLNIATIH